MKYHSSVWCTVFLLKPIICHVNGDLKYLGILCATYLISSVALETEDGESRKNEHCDHGRNLVSQ